MAKKLVLSIADIIFPPVCLNCGSFISNQEKLLCENCFAHIQTHTSFFCPHCGARLLSPHICHEKTPYILAAATKYEAPMPALIKYFKYHKLYPLEYFLSALLVAYLKSLGMRMDTYIVTYIPLHFWKERQRGFNQSRALAERVAKYFNIPCIQLLRRTRQTQSQARLSLQQRKENMHGAFSYISPHDVEHKNVMLIDDVCTTGTTLHEACITLKKHGARKIICLVVAKA